jgi:protein-tyrosine phosphatase
MLQPIWRKSPSRSGMAYNADESVRADPATPAVLFVCTANQIRSPLAEYLLRDQLRQRGDPNRQWRVESAGVWAQDELPVLDVVYQVGLDFGLDLCRHRTRSVASVALYGFDLVVAMEQRHAATLCNEFPQLSNRIMTLGEALSGYGFDIVDPAPHTPRAVRATARELAKLLTWGFSTLQQRVEALYAQHGVSALSR